MVDSTGVLRWQDDNSEVALLGVNYYTPFTIDFHEITRLNLDHREVIRDDVAHFRRLGLGCIRVHCFDRQISDVEGNLLDNIHLEMLDLLIHECRQNNLYAVLTPISWWDVGVGVGVGETKGFSELYTMQCLTTERTSWPIQTRFLKQFAEHVNRFTGRRYADDPCVLAFECINEPLYPADTPDSLVTAYINTLTDALRSSGTTKPIFYNSWHNRTRAAGASKVDGVSCVCYPTGLIAGYELPGPHLAKVQATSLKPDQFIKNKARIVYEFDAADTGVSYMYPALAKMFRAEGVQIATQFQYDPLPLAGLNRNWKTHHLNLVYTPGKALSLAIAAEVLAHVPRNTPYTPEQAELHFPPFRVSVTEDLSEMITTNSYLHSNTTRTPPPEPAALERVWGCGASPVVEYSGTGAYFFDRATPGTWRLQIYPDVFTTADPYSGSEEVKVKVLPTRHPMTVRLPDLGKAFTVWSTPGASMKISATALNGRFEARPGDFFLVSATHTESWLTPEIQLKLNALAPAYRAAQPIPESVPLIRAALAPQWRAGMALNISVEAVLATNLIARFVSTDGQTVEVPLKAQERSPSRFDGLLAGALLTPGVWGVTFHAAGLGGVSDYPSESSQHSSWLRRRDETVPLIVLPEESPSATGHSSLKAEVSLITDAPMPAIRLAVSDCGAGSAAAGYTLPFTQRTPGNISGSNWGIRIVARGGATGARAEIGFRMRNGHGLGYNLRLGSGWSDTFVPAAWLRPLWGLPSNKDFRWSEVESVTVLTGAWLFRDDHPAENQIFDLAALEWVAATPSLRLEAVAATGTWQLFDQAAWLRVPTWTLPLQRWPLRDDQGQAAVHLGAKSFDDEHSSLSLRAPCAASTFAKLWGTDGERSTLIIRARAAAPQTTGFELTFIEHDNVAWGTIVPLTTKWRNIQLPLNNLRLFTHWDQSMAARAGKQLRLSRLEAINLCFGRWLYQDAAAEPHAFEISAISIQP
ncbi:MAG: cellulase family glycosylhydrolase [Kiritimatiellae bacterium]|nr:cellulase family glycosylhydrolase [Kiritimatiellia bacterium]